MKSLLRNTFILAGLAAGGLPSLALAQPSVVIGPASSAAASAVPTLSGSLLIALSVLLAVVALRFLRQKGLQNKVMSVLMLGSGLLVGGFAVQESQATSVTVAVDNSACSGATVSIDPSRGDGTDPTAQLFNQCESASIQVISYDGYPCLDEELIHQGAAPGAVIAAGEDALLSYCPAPAI